MGERQTSTAEEINREDMLSLVEGGLEKVCFQGCFERGCRLDVTDLISQGSWRCASKRGPLTQWFCFCVGYFGGCRVLCIKYPFLVAVCGGWFQSELTRWNTVRLTA